MGFFDELDRPRVVALVSALFLLVNGLVFYRYATRPTVSAPASSPTHGDATTFAEVTKLQKPTMAGPAETTASQAPTADPAAAKTTIASKKPSLPEEPSLQERLEECSKADEGCLQEFIVEVAPKAVYAGGRIDTNVVRRR